MSSIDFAAAQERILARRRRRRSALRTHPAAPPPPPPPSDPIPSSSSSSKLSSALLARLPGPALRLIAKTLRSPYGTGPSFRVGQLDASLLDDELISLLRARVGEGLKPLSDGHGHGHGHHHLADEWEAEIGAGLRAVLWKLGTWDRGASYGAWLQGWRYGVEEQGAQGDGDGQGRGCREPGRGRRLALGAVEVVGRYGWEKWERWLVEREGEGQGWVERAARWSRAVGTGYEVAGLAGFLVFLYNGRYRTLWERLLGLRLVPTGAQTSREVSFEYLNRQLVWHAFTEFLLFILPLVGIGRWKRWLARAWRTVKGLVMRKSEDEDDVNTGELGFLPERTCAICYRDQNPTNVSSEAEMLAASSVSGGGGGGVVGSAQTDVTNPYEAIPCGCIYDFVCLAQRIEAEEGEGWTCLRCGETVKQCKPWSGDVVEEGKESRSTSGSKGSRKSVFFADSKDEALEEEDAAEVVPRGMLSPVEPMPLDDEDEDEDFNAQSDQDTFDEEDLTGNSTEWVRYEDAGAEQDAESDVSRDDLDGT